MVILGRLEGAHGRLLRLWEALLRPAVPGRARIVVLLLRRPWLRGSDVGWLRGTGRWLQGRDGVRRSGCEPSGVGGHVAGAGQRSERLKPWQNGYRCFWLLFRRCVEVGATMWDR